MKEEELRKEFEEGKQHGLNLMKQNTTFKTERIRGWLLKKYPYLLREFDERFLQEGKK